MVSPNKPLEVMFVLCLVGNRDALVQGLEFCFLIAIRMLRLVVQGVQD
jgi:hypothetical protein